LLRYIAIKQYSSRGAVAAFPPVNVAAVVAMLVYWSPLEDQEFSPQVACRLVKCLRLPLHGLDLAGQPPFTRRHGVDLTASEWVRRCRCTRAR